VRLQAPPTPASASTGNPAPSRPAACPSTTQQQTNGMLTATSSATSNISATVTAFDGAGTPLSQSVTITPPPLAISDVVLSPTSVTAGSPLPATLSAP